MSEAQHHLPDVGTSLSHSERRRIYQKLRLAALKGDWRTAKSYYSKYAGHEISCNARITGRNETVLHLAVTSDKVDFVKHVVQMMSDEDLAVQDDTGNTAFLLAVIAGKLKCVEVMMKRKEDLAKIRGGNHDLPLSVAVSRGHSKIIRLLYSASKSCLEDDEKINVFIELIYSNIYDVALDMLKEDKKLALGRNANDMTALQVLAQKSSLTADISSPNEPAEIRIWKNYIFQDSLLVKNFKRNSSMRKKALELMKFIWDREMELEESDILDLQETILPLIFIAAEKGNIEFLTTPFRSYPNLMLKTDKNGNTIFHIAILHRQEEVFKQIHHFYSVTEKLTMHRDDEGNNMLHLAAKLPADQSRLEVVPGAALQLQRELLWFEEVKKVVPLMACLEAKNTEGKTPEEVFIESHQEMQKEGEAWMKRTAKICIVVSTLIATMVFQAISNVITHETYTDDPCNCKSLEGCTCDPLINDISWTLFFVAGALALVLAVASVMAFLGIITSRFQLQDLCGSLLLKLIVRITTLFLSLAAMLVSFGAAMFNSYYPDYYLSWIGILFIPIASTPIFLFVWMELRLFTNVCFQTFRPHSIFKPNHLDFD